MTHTHTPKLKHIGPRSIGLSPFVFPSHTTPPPLFPPPSVVAHSQRRKRIRLCWDPMCFILYAGIATRTVEKTGINEIVATGSIYCVWFSNKNLNIELYVYILYSIELPDLPCACLAHHAYLSMHRYIVVHIVEMLFTCSDVIVARPTWNIFFLHRTYVLSISSLSVAVVVVAAVFCCCFIFCISFSFFIACQYSLLFYIPSIFFSLLISSDGEVRLMLSLRLVYNHI